MSTQALDRGYRIPRYYPVYLDLRGRRCVVVGGGGVALAKARGLADAGGHVTVISSESCAGLENLAALGQIALLRREYRRGDLSAVWLAIDASDGAATAQDMGREAAESGTLLNVHDQPWGPLNPSARCHNGREFDLSQKFANGSNGSRP